MSLVGRKPLNHPQQVQRRGARDDVDDRATPRDFFNAIHRRHGFTLDAAASPENALLERFYTRLDDGLSRSWGGERVWCNPPYSDLGRWTAKAWSAMLVECADLVVMLLPANRTEQLWWQAEIEPWRDRGVRGRGVRLQCEFLPGRIRFVRPSTWVKPVKGDRPPFGCCLLTWTTEASGI